MRQKSAFLRKRLVKLCTKRFRGNASVSALSAAEADGPISMSVRIAMMGYSLPWLARGL
jgi:hypothetical protein